MADDSTKTRILLAAGPIFAEKGFRGATVREICAAAEVNVASINYYFNDKDNLYVETVHFARQTQDSKYPYPDFELEMPPELKLRGFIETLLRRIMAMQDAQWQVRLLMNEVINPTGTCRHLVLEFVKPIFERLLQIIDQLAKQALKESIRDKIGFSIIGQCLFYRYSNNVASVLIQDKLDAQFDLESLADHITKFSLAAIQQGTWHSVRTNHQVDLSQ